jgi:hypothetical protein
MSWQAKCTMIMDFVSQLVSLQTYNYELRNCNGTQKSKQLRQKLSAFSPKREILYDK